MSTYEEMDFREGFAGVCHVNGTATCVAQPEDYCDDDTFVSAHYLRANGGHPYRYCAGELESVVIGRCADSGNCSNLPSRCQDEHSFVDFDPTCTISQDLSRHEVTYVTYGKCGDRCVWSSEDCIEGEEYYSDDPECTSEKVEIGACFAGHAFCAVGHRSCSQPGLPDEPFWTHQQVKEKVGANCFLSSLPGQPIQAHPVAAPPSLPGTITNDKANDFSAFDEDGIPNASPPSASGSSSDYKGLSEGSLVTIVTVVAVVVGIAVGISAVYCQKTNINKETWKRKIPLPVVDVETSDQVKIADDENLSDI